VDCQTSSSAPPALVGDDAGRHHYPALAGNGRQRLIDSQADRLFLNSAQGSPVHERPLAA